MMGPRVKGKAAFPAALIGALIIGVLGTAAFAMLVPATCRAARRRVCSAWRR